MQRKAFVTKVFALVLGCSILAVMVQVSADVNGRTGRSQTGCTCHGGSPNAGVTVTISGIPASYTPATSYTLVIAVSGNPTQGGGFDLSVTAGTLSENDPNARIANGEAVHSNENARSWTVSWLAPAAGTGTVTFYIAGLASNNNGATSGDAWNLNSYTSNEAVGNLPPTITLTSPSGTQDWTGGTAHMITWTMSDDLTPAAQLKVYLNYTSTPSSGTITGPLTGATSYSWNVPSIDATDVRVNATVIDGTGRKGYSQVLVPKVDSTRPTVLSAQPTGVSVGITAPVVVIFSETMSRTATQGALSLAPDPTGWSYSWSTTTVLDDTLTANHAAFAGATTYTATISTAAKDVSDTGNFLASPYQWSFTTGTTNTPPTTSITAPIGGESWSGGSLHNIAFTANDAQDPASSLLVWVNYSLTGGAPFNFQIAGLQGVSGTSSPYGWTVPTVNSNTVVLNSTVIDTAGLKGHANSAAFEIDSIAPTITATNPTSGATGIPTNVNILVTWSEQMNTAAAEAAFSLKDTATWTPVAGTFSWAGAIMTFTPAAFLSPATQYRANVTTLASDDSQPGNQLAVPYTWTFTTAVGADTTPPEVRSLLAAPNPQQVHLTVNVTVEIQDDVAVGEVWLDITDPVGGHLNATMPFDNSQNLYYLERPYDIVGLHTATVWAADTSGNWASMQDTFLIIDTIPPTVIDLTAVPNPVQVLASTNLSALVSDNYLVAGAWVLITAPDMTSTNLTMSPGVRYYRNTIPNQLGTYTFKVSASDAGGLWATASSTFLSVDLIPPVANAGADHLVPVNTQVTLDGSGSSDDFGIADYSWGFDDGSGPITLPGMTVQHTFPNLGSFLVTLTVTDFGGNSDADTAWVNVTNPDTVPPVADAGPDQSVPVNTQVTLDGSGSTDDIGIAYYNWTFNDGSGPVALSGATVQHTFATAGNFLVTLMVTDYGGNSDTDHAWVNVTSSSPPDADAGPDQTVNLGQPANFDGSQSTDSVGITSYTWTFNDNGPVSLNGITASHTFSQVGDYTVTLEVENAASLTDTDSLIVHVLPATDTQPPAAPLELEVEPAGPGALLLTWNANTEPDLAGYKVYRSLSPSGPFVGLTPDTVVTTTTYLDENLEGGHTYYYFVTAVDTSGNESARSEVESGYVGVVAQTQEAAVDWRWILAPALAFVVLGILFALLFRRSRKEDKQSGDVVVEKENEKGET